MRLPAGTKLGPYEILSPIGAGGMGEVYRARDSKLKRDVAIKVLPDVVARDRKALVRFEREAHAVAAMSHPNILAIHDFGSDDGVAYTVMELLDGQTLRTKIAPGPLSETQTRDYAIQIAKGLSAAHEKGVVHRDLKPENVFVGHDGHVKILDFGLAKRTTTETPEALSSASITSSPTEPGTMMGTVAYMSPEQLRGHDVDHRSDIFSFGALLYEMASGRKAFARGSAAETMAAILNQQPVVLSATDGRGSPALEQIVVRCLEKSAERRFQSARELVIALEMVSSASASSPGPAIRRGPRAFPWAAAALATGTAVAFLWTTTPPSGPARGGKPPRIVVLPFESTGAPEGRGLAAGLTEAVSARLANVQGLSVISRITAGTYDRRGKATEQIGSDLRVDYVLEGTVTWDRGPGRDGRVRIAPALTQVADDTQVWAGQYDRLTTDVFAIQSEVAENVVKAMGVKLLPREQTALRTVSTHDAEAHDFYMRGLEFVNRGGTKEAQESALRMFQAAVDRDPNFTQALSRLSRMHSALYFFHWDHSPSRVERARETLDRLAALGPDLPETRVARGFYLYFTQADYPRALEEFRAALRLQPSNTDVIEGIAYVLRRQGRLHESAAEISKWLEVDPRSANALYQNGTASMMVGRYAEADRLMSLATSFNPRFLNAWHWRVRLQLLSHGDVERARALLAEAGQVDGLTDAVGLMTLEAYRIALFQRDYTGALGVLEGETRQAFSNQFFHLPIDLLRAVAHDLAGQEREARRGYQAARSALQDLIAKEPDDPRYYGALGVACAGLGLREEALQAANRGVQLMPPSSDHWRAMWRIEDLALVHTMLGEHDRAIDRLDFLLARTGEVSARLLQLDPRWQPLATNPRFKMLLSKHGARPATG